jgi:hypothetical protein
VAVQFSGLFNQGREHLDAFLMVEQANRLD